MIVSSPSTHGAGLCDGDILGIARRQFAYTRHSVVAIATNRF